MDIYTFYGVKSCICRPDRNEPRVGEERIMIDERKSERAFFKMVRCLTGKGVDEVAKWEANEVSF